MMVSADTSAEEKELQAHAMDLEGGPAASAILRDHTLPPAPSPPSHTTSDLPAHLKIPMSPLAPPSSGKKLARKSKPFWEIQEERKQREAKIRMQSATPSPPEPLATGATGTAGAAAAACASESNRRVSAEPPSQTGATESADSESDDGESEGGESQNTMRANPASLRAAAEAPRPMVPAEARGVQTTPNEQQEEDEPRQQQEEEPQCECDDERRKTTSAVSPNPTFLLPAEVCKAAGGDGRDEREPSAAEVATEHEGEQLAAATDVEEAWLDADSSGRAASLPTGIATLVPSRGADHVVRYALLGVTVTPPTELAASVSRRYREWLALRDALPRDLLSAIVQPFPPRRWNLAAPLLCAMIAPENHPELVLEERVVALRDWANALLALPEARQRDDVRAFFLGEQMGPLGPDPLRL